MVDSQYFLAHGSREPRDTLSLRVHLLQLCLPISRPLCAPLRAPSSPLPSNTCSLILGKLHLCACRLSPKYRRFGGLNNRISSPHSGAGSLRSRSRPGRALRCEGDCPPPLAGGGQSLLPRPGEAPPDFCLIPDGAILLGLPRIVLD